MGEATILTMGILSPSDAPSVSTIVEEMFQFFDESVRCANYKTIDRSVRLRLALRVLGDAGYARLDIMRPKPTVVPTEKLLQLLEVKKLTTDEEPLSLLPAGACVSSRMRRASFSMRGPSSRQWQRRWQIFFIFQRRCSTWGKSECCVTVVHLVAT